MAKAPSKFIARAMKRDMLPEISASSERLSSRATAAAKARLSGLSPQGAAPKALQATKDAIAKEMRRGGPIAEGSAAEARVWQVARNKGPLNLGGLRQLTKAAAKGLFSPAGLAEGVAGATVKAMKASGAYDKPMKVMQSKGGKGGPGKSRRTGERA